ncbi:dynein beta chain, flagellar outer arm-like [Asterias rubens]|uniref:dynein beta chain, flagellar outer arm-like n=1 Tax=Asterias rubens TaxID=7604 RepID=UPI00145586A2|nr:dynein beta chain, flagellar outer arm-like [Asterias rubens]
MLRTFPPLIHTVLLVWSHSRYYHNTDKFQNLLELVSNEVVLRAQSLVGEDILKNTLQSYAGLKDALKVCAAYRGTYLDTKDKADDINTEKVSETAEAMTLHPPKGVLYSTKLYSTSQRKRVRSSHGIWRDTSSSDVGVIQEDEWTDSQWPPRNAPCFNLMNGFMERCNDLLELVQTTRHFNLLQMAAEVGGAGTKSLDALVREIHKEFSDAMEDFGDNVMDILDITESKAFEKAFFNFRSIVKDLERRLAIVLHQSFQQCPTIGAQLRLLEVFEGVSGREMVQEYLREKDKQLISSFTQELIAVRSMFLAKRNSPPNHVNLPPVVSRLTWVGALKKRIQHPMEKLKRISPHSLEGDAGWHLRDIFADTMKDFEEYQESAITKWQCQLHDELRDRLKQPLLIADDYDPEIDYRPQIIHVNLDPELLLLLREVHYLQQPPFTIKLQDTVRDLLRNTDSATLRTTAARLETIVSKYNSAMRSLVDFERPLFERKLGKIDHLLEQGLTHYTWKTTESADFIELASSLVGADLHRTLAIVQSNCQEMVDLAQSWSSGYLDVFACRDPNASYHMAKLLEWQRSLNEDHERLVKPSGQRIHYLLSISFEAVQISRASPAWEDYVDHIDALVLDGLKQASLKSLRSMLNTLVHSNMAEAQGTVVPILTIRMELIENVVSVTPPLDQSTAVTSVLENVSQWLEEFKNRGSVVKMLNHEAEGGYQNYIGVDEDVQSLCEQILQLVKENGDECMTLLELFKNYTFLWMHNINETFDEFLHGRLSSNPMRDLEKLGPSAGMRSAASERSLRSAQSGRASSASQYSIGAKGAMGTAEKFFLTPKDTDEYDNVPPLDMFDAEIDVYRTARDEIENIFDYKDVGWIRVDLQPIKQVLTTYASRWMWTFTKYLTDQVTELLTDLDTFLKRIEPEIESISGEERDTASFMKMMRIFNEVSAKQQEMDGQFTAMNRTVLLLKKYAQALPDRTKGLYDAAPGRWNNLKTKVSLAKQRLGPRIQEESASITKDLESFGERVETLQRALSSSDIYTYNCSIDTAFKEINKFMQLLEKLDNEAQDLIELQELLETAVVNFTVLPECRHELRNLKLVWETVDTIHGQQEEWKQQSWQKMNTKFLREVSNGQLEQVKGLPEEAHYWDVYLGLEDSILIIQASLPLIEDLSNPAMRTRHWKQLVRVTGGALLIDNENLKRMTLGQLLQLGLQNHVDEVRAIVQRAVKDVTIESALKTYEEIWLSKIFELRPHVRVIGGASSEKQDKEETDTKSEYSQSDAGTVKGGATSGRRAQSRMSSFTIGTAGRAKRASVSSLPGSLLNLGEDSGTIFLLHETDPIFTELESHQVALQSMQGSSAAGSFLDEVTKWQKRLQTIEAVLSTWLEVQEKWVELEEIFSGSDVKTSLNHEAGLFGSANRDFRLLMRASEKNPNVLQCCQRRGILNILEKMNTNLELCRRSLIQYLERRRQRFPRFYFLSMEDVLHIVCNGYDLNQVNLYLPKLFENLGRLDYEENQSEAAECTFNITGLISNMGEKMSLKQIISCDGPIENWLSNLLPMVRLSLQTQLTSALGNESLEPPGTPRRGEREIHSAGARRVTVGKDERKGTARSRAGSRTGSRNHRPGTRDSQDSRGHGGYDGRHGPQSWMLDHVTEVVYLATQIQITEQTEKCLKMLEGGDRDSMKETVDKVKASIQAAVVMLKGVEDENERRVRLEKEKIKKEAAAMKEADMTSVMDTGTVVSHTGRQSSQSHKNSQWSLNNEMPGGPPAGNQPTIAEEGSTLSGQQGENGEGLETVTTKPMDTMKVVLPPERPKVKVKVEEKIDKSELQLMLFPGQIQKISNLITLLAHQRDLLQRLIDKQDEIKGSLQDSFEWRSHLRYVWNESTMGLSVKMLDTTFDYGFEYMGSGSRLVLTPMTERVFLSMGQAIKARMAALCVGPSWSGRLELVQEMGRILGQPLYLFNCSHATDSQMLGDIFRGLASTGAWVCLNNLSHIPAPVLSIFSQLLQSFLDALRMGKSATVFPFQTDEVAVNANGACFATLDSSISVPGVSLASVDGRVLLNSASALLPSKLSKLMRTVSVAQVDLRLSLEALLWSQGFTKAIELSHKMIALRELYTKMIPNTFFTSQDAKLGSDLSEDSRGWSLQSIRSIVLEGGAILDELLVLQLAEEQETALNAESLENIAEAASDLPEKGVNELPESLTKYEGEAIVTALRNNFMPRLHGSDAEMFVSMIEDVFPDIGVPMGFAGLEEAVTREGKLSLNTPVVSTHPASTVTQILSPTGGQEKQPLDDIHAAIAVATSELGLLPGTAFQARVAQLAQLTDSHQTVIIAGPAGCGKSECIKTLVGAQREMGNIVTAQRIFTQAVESQELLGYADPKTKEWRDGLFTSLLRKLCLVHNTDFTNSKPIMKTLHLDGGIDPAQMEIFSSVFHSDGALVLANNERIHVPDNLRIFWEMESLASLSPSALSRTGLLSMDTSDVSWELILASWLDRCSETDQEVLRKLTDRYVGPTLMYLDRCTKPAMMVGKKEGVVGKARMKRMIDVSDMSMVMTFCSLLEALITQGSELEEALCERYINFACIWAFAGTLEERYRSTFSAWWLSEWGQYIDYPEGADVFDYFVDGESQEFVHWNEAVPPYSMPPHEGIPPDAFVHTVSIEQTSYLLGLLSDAGRPILLTGESGCGKTAIVNDRIRTVCSGEVAEVLSLSVTTNRFTTSRVLWQRLEERLEWKHGRTYVPKGSKKLMCHVDDLNLAYVDNFGRQSACEMVRQHLDSGGMYEPDTHRLREVKNVSYVTTINPNSPAKVPRPSQRLIRHFSVFGVPYPKPCEVHSIFTTLLNTHFLTPATTSSTSARDRRHHIMDKEEEQLRALVSMIVNVTIEIQDRMRTMYLPTAERCHYIFTLRDIRKMFRNICISLRPNTTREKLLMLWRHECEFIYGQRLVSPVDFDRYQQAFVTAARKEFSSEELLQLVINPSQPLFSNLVQQDSGIVTAGGYRTTSTGSSIGEDDPTDQYRPCEDVDSVRVLLQDAVEEYNKSHAKIKLALYRETLQRVCHIARTIMSPHDVGHATLVAEGNPGLSNLFARLAAHLCGFSVFEVNPSPMSASVTYKLDQFKADLVAAYTKAGVKGEKILLLLTDEELLNEDFLVYVGEFVVTGAITHLFSAEEQTSIINSIRTEVTAAGLTYTRETAWDFFLKTVCSNFRVILVSSSSGASFQDRCRRYPALTAHLSCHWYQHWSRENLVDHALFHLNNVETLNHIQRENLAHLLATMHLAIRQLDGEEQGPGQYRHLTNTTYEKFVERFLSMYHHRQQKIQTEHVTVTRALEHINKENKLATKLQKQLEHELVVLEERKEGTVKLLSQIGQDKAIAEQQIKIVHKQMEKIQKLKKALPQYSLAHARAVYKTVAVVQDTKKVVQELDINSLGELRGMQKPDVDIEDLMASIIMILKSPSSDLTWSKGAKRQMANIERFLEELMLFDDSELPESTLNLVEPYLKKASFQPQNMQRKTNNLAAASLCKWVRGVVRYHRLMISKVKPLHAKVEETTAAVEEAEHRLSTLENKKKALEMRLADLSQSFEEATVDKNDQEDLSKKMSRELQTANKFKEILEMEHKHCIQICQSLPQREFAIPGAVAMAAAFATYLGAYDTKFRRVMLTIQWPMCLQERGVPLLIDAVDPMKGWIVEWAIHTNRTRSNTVISSVQSNDGGANTPRDAQEQPQEIRRELDDENVGGVEMQEEAKEGGVEERNETILEEGEIAAETETQNKNAVQDTPRNGVPGDINGGYRSPDIQTVTESQYNYTVDNFPQISSNDFTRYVQALIKLLVGESALQEWITKGLCLQDMENLAIQKSSWQRPPFLIDPHMEGVRWLRKVIHRRKLTNIDMHTRFDPSIVVQIEKAILSGLPLVLVNCDERLDSMVMPLIHHANHGNECSTAEDARLIKYCGRRLLGHQNFCVSMTTSLPNPQFSPRIASTTTLINYSPSPEALKEALLARAFWRVSPALYAERRKVLRAIRQHRSTLQVLEEQLLQTLEGEVCSGDITAHTDYVSAIVDNKDQVYVKLVEAERILETLDNIRDELVPVAKRGAMLFSITASLMGVQHEYQFSLPFFLWMFDQAVGEDQEEEIASDDGEDLDSATEVGGHHSPLRPLGVSASTRFTENAPPLTDQDTQESGITQDGSEAPGSTDDTANAGNPEDTQTQAESLQHQIMAQIAAADLPDLPTQGVDYNSLSANQVKQLVDCLTQTIYQNIRQSLYEEHRLLFSTMLCLNIQYETTELFSEEELALLLQGNPGLGNMELSLEDFDCDSPVPCFLTQDKWEDLMAISVLPGPLDGLCVQFAQRSSEWEAWYKCAEPENEPMPYRPMTSEEEEHRPVDNEGQTSAQSTPDLGSLTEFHQLILLRLLRPDRFPSTARRYVTRHLTSVTSHPSSIGSILGSKERLLGVLVLLPPTPAFGNQQFPGSLKMKTRPVDVLRGIAQNISFNCITLGDGAESRIDIAIDTAADNDGWLVIEDLHLASANLLAGLRHQLIRVGNTGGPLGLNPINTDSKSRFCIWLTSEPSGKLSDALLQALRIISWDNLNDELLGSEDPAQPGPEVPIADTSLDDLLKTAIVSALDAVTPMNWKRVQDQSTMYIRGAAFGACVVHGLLAARQMFGTRGLTRWYGFSQIQPNHAMDVILGSSVEGQGSKVVAVEELCRLLAEVVYGNALTSDWDRLYLNTIVQEVLSTTTSQSESLNLGGVPLPTPPANVDPTDYARWFEDKWVDGRETVKALSLDEGICKVVNKISGNDFLHHLDTLYELQHTGSSALHDPTKSALNMTKVQAAMDGVIEQLPPMLDLGELPLQVVNEKERYTFPYHAPSLMSLLSVTSAEMPQSIGYVLLQECHWFNSLLCHVRQTLHELMVHLLGGERGMAPSLTECARALQKELVPVSWVHPNRQPLGHTLHSWVTDLLKRYSQLRAWVKEGKVPNSSQDPDRPSPPKGSLMSVWMGGLANPTAVFTALRHEKSALEGCMMSQIGITCEVSTTVDTDSFEIVHEGGMYLRDVWLEGACWNLEHGCLGTAGSTLVKMPSIYIRPVRLDAPALDAERSVSSANPASHHEDENQAKDRTEGPELARYTCPVFMNRSRQICAFTLELACPAPMADWILAGAALILDPGIPEDCARKWPKPSHRKHEEPPVPVKDDTQSDRSASVMSKLSTALYGHDPQDPRVHADPASRHSSHSQRSLRSRQSFRTEQPTTLLPASEQLLELPEQEADSEHNEDERAKEEDGDNKSTEDLDSMMTARSAQLERERHQHSAFDYRDSQNEKDSVNTNQNADPSVGEQSNSAEQPEQDSKSNHEDERASLASSLSHRSTGSEEGEESLPPSRQSSTKEEDDASLPPSPPLERAPAALPAELSSEDNDAGSYDDDAFSDAEEEENGGSGGIQKDSDQNSVHSHSSKSHHSYQSNSASDREEEEKKEEEQAAQNASRKSSASQRSQISAKSRVSVASSQSKQSQASVKSSRTASAVSQKSTASGNQGTAYRASSFGSLHQSLDNDKKKAPIGQSRTSLQSGKSKKSTGTKNENNQNSQGSIKSAQSLYSNNKSADRTSVNRSQISVKSAGSAEKEGSRKPSASSTRSATRNQPLEKPSSPANSKSSRRSVREQASPVGSQKSVRNSPSPADSQDKVVKPSSPANSRSSRRSPSLRAQASPVGSLKSERRSASPDEEEAAQPLRTSSASSKKSLAETQPSPSGSRAGSRPTSSKSNQLETDHKIDDVDEPPPASPVPSQSNGLSLEDKPADLPTNRPQSGTSHKSAEIPAEPEQENGLSEKPQDADDQDGESEPSSDEAPDKDTSDNEQEATEKTIKDDPESKPVEEDDDDFFDTGISKKDEPQF